MAGRSQTDTTAQAVGARLGAYLRQLREERQWSRRRLADAAGLSAKTVESIERAGAANPGFFTIAALADALDVAMDDLLRVARQPAGGLLSVGYEGVTLDGFVDLLAQHHVHTVADVRLTPISRKPGFSKTRLNAALAEANIEYLHLRALGNPKDNRAPFWEGRLEEGRTVFRNLLASEAASLELNQLHQLAAREHVAVLCFERDQQRCHRQVILDVVARRSGLAVQAVG